MFDKVMPDPEQPAPPEEIPNYVAEGLQSQAVPTLRKIMQYCEELIAYLEQPPDPEELSDADDVVDVEENESGGTVVIRRVKCGSDCTCNDGNGHGPYKYVVSRDGNGGHNWEYKGKA